MWTYCEEVCKWSVMVEVKNLASMTNKYGITILCSLLCATRSDWLRCEIIHEAPFGFSISNFKFEGVYFWRQGIILYDVFYGSVAWWNKIIPLVLLLKIRTWRGMAQNVSVYEASSEPINQFVTNLRKYYQLHQTDSAHEDSLTRVVLRSRNSSTNVFKRQSMECRHSVQNSQNRMSKRARFLK